MWDLIESVPGHCLSFYFEPLLMFRIRTENQSVLSNIVKKKKKKNDEPWITLIYRA